MLIDHLLFLEDSSSLEDLRPYANQDIDL